MPHTLSPTRDVIRPGPCHGTFVCEASALGLEDGNWPELLLVSYRNFRLVHLHWRPDATLSKATYFSGAMKLTVYNN